MTQIILIIIGIAIIVILLSRILRQAQDKKGALRQTQDKIVGICAIVLNQTVRKNANKEKILGLFKKRAELSNSDIREALGVSERTAVRYMDELEREGKVEQVGNTGRSVQYRLKR